MVNQAEKPLQQAYEAVLVALEQKVAQLTAGAVFADYAKQALHLEVAA